MKLLEAFKDFEVVVNSYSYSEKYRVERVIKPKEYPLKITEKDIEKYVSELQKKYPNKGYRYKIVKYKGERFAVIRRGPLGFDNPPIYISLDTGRIYVPESYYKRKPKLVNFLIMMRVYDLLGGKNNVSSKQRKK